MDWETRLSRDFLCIEFIQLVLDYIRVSINQGEPRDSWSFD